MNFFTQKPQKCKAFNEVKSRNLPDVFFHAEIAEIAETDGSIVSRGSAILML